jgi:drug/metabolite transporter (DMT)-like permease
VANFLILILVNVFWAVQFAAAKIATDNMGPITVTVVPMLISVLTMAPFLALRKRNPEPPAIPRGSVLKTVFGFILLGTFGIVISQLCLTWGISRSLASNAAVITLGTPAITAVTAYFMLRERMTAVRWISFILAFGGVLMCSDIDWKSVQLLQGRFFFGNMLLFASLWGASFYNTYAKKLLSRFTPFEVTVYSFTVCALVLLPLALILEPMPWSRWASFGWPVWISLVSISVFSLTLATVLFFGVLQKLHVTQAILSVYMSPIFGVLIAAVTVNEKITLQLVLGGALVFLSTFLVTYYEERMNRRAAAAQA